MMTLRNLFCRLLLLCICVIFLQTSDTDNACKMLNGEPLTFYSCGTNCSQWDDYGFLNCSIGKKEEVEAYNFTDYPPLAPPDLIDIKYLYGPIQGDYSGSIYIQFRLPHAVRRVFPDAVRLFFQGLSKDDYYNTSPRHRIFIFHNYNPESMRESVHPRNISYNCFYGVEREPVDRIIIDTDYRIRYKKGYLLGLKSNPGRWINYTVTINAITPAIPKEQWIPTIAVSLDVTNHTLMVLVEKEPADVQLQYATAELHMVNNKAGLSEDLVEQKCTFHGLVHGRYIVRAIIRGTLNGKFQNWTGESVEIDARAIPKDEYPIHYADPSVKPLKIFSMVGGCLIGLALLVLLGGVVYRHRVCKKVLAFNRTAKGFILHPYDYEPNSITSEFITKFGRLLENKCACSLLSWKPIKSKSREEVKKWLENEFRSLTFIIVFYNSSCYDIEDINANSYSCILNEAVKRKKMSLLHIIPICLTFSHSLPSAIAQEIHVEWDDIDELYCRIHGHVEVPLKRKKSLSGKWKSTNTGKDLLELFRRLPIQMSLGSASCHQNQVTDTREDILSFIQPKNNEDLACKPLEPQALEDMKTFAMKLNTENDENLKESQIKECKTEATLHSIKADVHSVKNDETEIKSPHQHTPPDTLYHLHPPQRYPYRSDQYHQLVHGAPDIEEMSPTARHQRHMIPCESDIHPLDRFRPSHALGFCDRNGLPIMEMNGHIRDDPNPTYPDETYLMMQRENESQADFSGNQMYRPPTCEHQNMHDLPQRPSFEIRSHPDLCCFLDIDRNVVQRPKTCRPENFALPIHCQSRSDVPHRNAISPSEREFGNPDGSNRHEFLSEFHDENMPLLQMGGNPDNECELGHRTGFKAIDPPPFEKETWSSSTQDRLQHKPQCNRKDNGSRIDNSPMSGHRMNLDALDLLSYTSKSVVNHGHFQDKPDHFRKDHGLDQSWDDVIVSISQTDLTEGDFEQFNPVPPSNHESEESIASGKQLDELLKINKEASKGNH